MAARRCERAISPSTLGRSAEPAPGPLWEESGAVGSPGPGWVAARPGASGAAATADAVRSIICYVADQQFNRRSLPTVLAALAS